MPLGGAGWIHPENWWQVGWLRLGVVGGSAGLAGARCMDRGLCGKMSAVMPSAHARSIRKSTPVLNYGQCMPYLIIVGHTLASGAMTLYTDVHVLLMPN